MSTDPDTSDPDAALLELPFDQYQRYRVAADLVALLDVPADRPIVDVGGGPGFAEAFLPDREAVVVDVEGKHPGRFVIADGARLPFTDRTFACVTSAFLLRNLADLEQGLREMKRVTRVGGRVVALEITQPTLPGFTPIFRVYFHRIVPWVGQLVESDREAYTYLPQSVDRFLAPGALSKLMERIGMRAVTYRRLGMGTVTVHTGIV